MPSSSKLSRLFKTVTIKDKRNNRTENASLFLSILPAELRNLVYEILIANYVLSTDPRTGRIRIAEEASNETESVESLTVLSKSSAESLPLVNRLVSREYYSVLAITHPESLRFRESRKAARDRALSFSLGNIRQRLREPTSNHVLNQLSCLMVEYKSLITLIRPVEERFFGSLQRIDITGVPSDEAEIKALHSTLNFRGYKKSRVISTDATWVFEYDEQDNEYKYHRQMSFAQLGLASGLINATQEARAIRSISDARIVEAQPVPY